MYVDISEPSEQIVCSINAKDRRINSDTQVLPDDLEKISEIPDLKTAFECCNSQNPQQSEVG